MRDLTQAFRAVGPRKSIDQRLGLPAKTEATATDPGAKRSRRLLARMIGAVLEPVWYWLDLYGPDDHPSNTKVMASAAIITGLLIILAIAISCAVAQKEPTLEFYGFASFIIAGAAAWDAQKTRTKTRAAVDVITSGATMTSEQTSTSTTVSSPGGNP